MARKQETPKKQVIPKILIVGTVVCLIVGIVAGYFIGNTAPQSKIREYQSQVSNLNSKITNLEQTSSNQQSQISSLQSDKSKLQTDLNNAQSKIQAAEQAKTALESQISDLQKRISKILDINAGVHYEWTHQLQTWSWDIPMKLSLYVQAVEEARPKSADYWVSMAKDPRDDRYLDEIARRINDTATRRLFSDVEKMNFLGSFVQGLAYKVDKVTTPYDEYPRFPIETLFDKTGDSEDTSILAAAILDRLGFDSAIVVMKNVKHIGVGIAIPYNWGAYYDAKGKRYYYLETTGAAWQLGQVPPEITDRTADVYPLR